MRINHNLTALDTYNRLSTNSANTAKSIEKLSSGFRINRASDDAVSLQMAKKRFELEKAAAPFRQVQDTQNKLVIAEGALNETHSMLIRMKELATQAINGTNTDSDRTKLQEEFNTLNKEITSIGELTNYNGQKLLDGSSRIVTQTSGGQDRSLKIGDMRSEALGISDLSISTNTDATAALLKIDEAMSKISDQRSSIGGEMNGLDEMIRNIYQGKESSEDSTSTSRIRSIDIEEEMRKFREASLKSAHMIDKIHQNQNPIGILQLLRG